MHVYYIFIYIFFIYTYSAYKVNFMQFYKSTINYIVHVFIVSYIILCNSIENYFFFLLLLGENVRLLISYGKNVLRRENVLDPINIVQRH